MTNSAGKLRKICGKHHIVIRHIVKVQPFRFNIVYTLKEFDKRFSQVDENAPFQTKLDGKQIQVFVYPFSSF